MESAAKQWFYTPDHQASSEAVDPILKLVFPILAAAGPGMPHEQAVEAEYTAQ